MDKPKVKISRFRTIAWGFRIAWSIDKFTMLLWFTICGALSVLPAIALHFNRETLSVLSGFLSGGAYTYADVVKPIISLGVLMIVIGLSARVNVNLLYIVMYDKYYAGWIELIADIIWRIDLTDLLNKDVADLANFARWRAGSLTDFVSGACAIIGKFISIASLLVVAFGISKLIFAVSLVYVVAVFVLNFMATRENEFDKIARLEENRRIEYYEKMRDNKGMSKEVRIYEHTDEIVRQWEKPYVRVRKAEEKRAFITQLSNFIGGAGFYVFLMFAIGISLNGLAQKTVTVDIFLVLFTLCLNIYNAIKGTADSIKTFDYGLFALEKQHEFFDIAPVVDPATDADKADTPADEDIVFNVKDLNFSYGEKQTIKDISFTVRRGEIIALVGQNGSGKSTLVKLLLNMYRPDSGAIEFLGRKHSDYKRDFLRSKVGVFFQDFFLFYLPFRGNIGMGAVEDIEDEAKIQDAIQKGGATKVVQQLKNGLDTIMGKTMDTSGTELSGGERQRVGTSRAHMSNRDILIFDEPASMLDPIAEMEQFNNIREKLEGRTAILISHRVGFARMADKVIMLNDGEIAEMGSHNELMGKNGMYAHFFNEQAQWYDTANVQKGGDTE